MKENRCYGTILSVVNYLLLSFSTLVSAKWEQEDRLSLSPAKGDLRWLAELRSRKSNSASSSGEWLLQTTNITYVLKSLFP